MPPASEVELFDFFVQDDTNTRDKIAASTSCIESPILKLQTNNRVGDFGPKLEGFLTPGGGVKNMYFYSVMDKI